MRKKISAKGVYLAFTWRFWQIFGSLQGAEKSQEHGVKELSMKSKGHQSGKLGKSFMKTGVSDISNMFRIFIGQ